MSLRKLLIFLYVAAHSSGCVSSSSDHVIQHSSPEACEASIAQTESDYTRIRELHNKEANVKRGPDGKLIIDHGPFTETVYCKGATAHFVSEETIQQSVPDEKPVLKLLHYGVVSGESEVSLSADPNSTTGVQKHADYKVICLSQKVPARMGVAFGIGFKVYGLDRSRKYVSVVATTTHPPIKGLNGKVTTEQVWNTKTAGYKDGGYYGLAGHVFDDEGQLKEGNWSIAVEAYGQKIKKEFKVIRGINTPTDRCEKI